MKNDDSGYSPVPAVIDSDFQLAFNQEAALESADLAVRFKNVAEDSRCPVGVQCIWPGQAKIDLVVKRGEQKSEIIQLISFAGKPELAIQKIGDYYIKLVKVEPPRTVEGEMWLSNYKITLTISQNAESGE